MTHGSLFSGIGGFDLAAEWAGFKNVFQCEIDPFCQKVLAKNFPGVKRYANIRDFQPGEMDRADIISGGFPCQPFSVAGKQRGKSDNRYLWPEMLRIIRTIRPRWIVGENVAGIVNMALDQVYSDLEAENYTVQAFIIPAVAVNAPHRRERVWIVANSNSAGIGEIQNEQTSGGIEDQKRPANPFKSRNSIIANSIGQMRKRWSSTVESEWPESAERKGMERATSRHGKERIIADSNSAGLEKQHASGKPERPGFRSGRITPDWSNWPTQPGICGRNDGFSCRLDGNCKQCHRNQRIKSLGNAIVPQVAYEIFKAIKQVEGL